MLGCLLEGYLVMGGYYYTSSLAYLESSQNDLCDVAPKISQCDERLMDSA